MPISQPSLTQLIEQAAQDIQSELPGTDALLRFSNLNIIARAVANQTKLQYGYLDYIAQNATPFNAVEEYLEGWSGLRGVIRKPASQAGDKDGTGTTAYGAVTLTGIAGKVLPVNSLLQRGDGKQFYTTAEATINGIGSAVAPVVAQADITGKTGADGNTSAGVTMRIANPIAGINTTATVTTAVIGGADLEDDDSLRNRMLAAYRTIPGAGTPDNFVEWALLAPGVTRAWAKANGMGSGTVVVYTMLDTVRAAFGGFPQGTDGVATGEPRDAAATGDQLLVANTIFTRQSATPLVYSVAPINAATNFTIAGLSSATAATKSAVEAAISDTFRRLAAPGGVGSTAGAVAMSDVNSAIAAVPNTSGFYITSPAAALLTPAPGALLTLGTVTYT